jgi:hypothetical protein
MREEYNRKLKNMSILRVLLSGYLKRNSGALISITNNIAIFKKYNTRRMANDLPSHTHRMSVPIINIKKRTGPLDKNFEYQVRSSITRPNTVRISLGI